MTTYTIALAGNPNTGKSTLFNTLTGAEQHVGNWPGKTVEKKEGVWRHQGESFQIIDLPGIYSLSAYSLEEVVARDFILDQPPHLLVIVADAANLERNLYLVVQLLEMEIDAVLALNMSDVAASRGLHIDRQRLAQALGMPVIAMVARRNEGVEELKARLPELLASPRRLQAAADYNRPGGDVLLSYGPEIDAASQRLQALIAGHPQLRDRYPARWLALKLLEAETDLAARVAAAGAGELLAEAAAIRAQLQEALGEDLDILIADRRYTWINRLIAATVQQAHANKRTLSDHLDGVVTHPWLGLPIFLAAMWVAFKLTTDVAAPYLEWIEYVLGGPVSYGAAAALALAGLGESWLASLVVDGVIAGVGGVLVFVPVLMSLYVVLALLEDSGYMARAAFVMDRLMRLIGLHGRSFVPLVLGFGCNVPAIYATRSLESQRDRLLTGLLVPFMSCAARLPVYVLFAAIFFPRHSSLAVFSMYLIGIATAIAVGLMLRRTLFRTRAETGLLMELPPYRLPTVRNVWRYTWQRTRDFLHGAATIILATSIVVWFLLSVPQQGKGSFAGVEVEDSAFAGISTAIAPVFQPLGFGTWEATTALLSGFVAKEVVVSTLAQVHRVGPEEEADAAYSFTEGAAMVVVSFAAATLDTLKSLPLIVGINLFDDEAEDAPSGLMAAIQDRFGRSSNGHAALAGFAFMVFVLLYTPCMAVVAAQRQELGAGWMWASIAGQFALAWLASFAVFQGGLLLGLG